MKKRIKYLLMLFLWFIQLSCNGQKTVSKEEQLNEKWKKAEFYAAKYFPAIKTFRRKLFEEYFKNMDVAHLKTKGKCSKSHPILHPISFNLKIDSILVNNIPFSEKVLYVSVIYFRQNMPESIIWCSDMNNYCTAENDFMNTYVVDEINNGDCHIENGGSVGVFKSKQDNAEIIYLGTDSLLRDYPILLKIYLKKDSSIRDTH